MPIPNQWFKNANGNNETDPLLPSVIKPELYYFDEYQTYDLVRIDEPDERILALIEPDNIIYSLLDGEPILIERFYPSQSIPHAHNYGLDLLNALKKYASTINCQPHVLWSNSGDRETKNKTANAAAVMHGSFLGFPFSAQSSQDYFGITNWVNPNTFTEEDTVFSNTAKYINIPSFDELFTNSEYTEIWLTYLAFDVENKIKEYSWQTIKVIPQAEDFVLNLPNIQPWSLVITCQDESIPAKIYNHVSNNTNSIKANYYNLISDGLNNLINSIDAKLPDIGKILLSCDLTYQWEFNNPSQFGVLLNGVISNPLTLNMFDSRLQITVDNYQQINYPTEKRFYCYIFANNNPWGEPLNITDIKQGDLFFDSFEFSFYKRYSFDTRDHLNGIVDYSFNCPFGVNAPFHNINNYGGNLVYSQNGQIFINDYSFGKFGSPSLITLGFYSGINTYVDSLIDYPVVKFNAPPLPPVNPWEFVHRKDNTRFGVINVPFLQTFLARLDGQFSQANFKGSLTALWPLIFDLSVYLSIFKPLWSSYPIFLFRGFKSTESAENYDPLTNAKLPGKSQEDSNVSLTLANVKKDDVTLLETVTLNYTTEQAYYSDYDPNNYFISTAQYNNNANGYILEFSQTITRELQTGNSPLLEQFEAISLNDIIAAIDDIYYLEYYLNNGEYLETMPDSIRVKEIHASLQADKFSKNDNNPNTPRVANLGYYIERLARILGISVNSDGSIRSIRQSKWIAQGDTIPAGWTIGQWGRNQGGSTSGQQGGSPDEDRDGLAYEVKSNFLTQNSKTPTNSATTTIEPGGYVLVENIPQLTHVMLQDLDRALGLQESGAFALPNADGSDYQTYEGLHSLLVDTAFMLSRLGTQIFETHTSSLKNQAMLYEVLKSTGLLIEDKNINVDISTPENPEEIGIIKYKGLNKDSPTLTDILFVILQNLAILVGGTINFEELKESQKEKQEQNIQPDVKKIE